MGDSFDVIIVGAGLTGCLHAYFLSRLGYKVAVYEQSSSIGGLCKTENMFGINVHCHGPHIFHTNSLLEWMFVNKICEFDQYFIDVKADRDGVQYDFPINLNTIRQVYGEDAEKITNKIFDGMNNPDKTNLETFAKSVIGDKLYEMFVKYYTEKQWGRDCSELPYTILKRIPVYLDDSRNYHKNIYSGVPHEGWTYFMECLLRQCDVFLEQKLTLDNLTQSRALVIYTGRIDELFDYDMGELEFRGIRHDTSILNQKSFQGRGVVNYTGPDPFTRIIEHKFLGNNGHDLNKTVVSCEYPDQNGIKCYPIETDQNNALYEKYRARLRDLSYRIRLCGRLAEYRYFNMNDIVGTVLRQYGVAMTKTLDVSN